MSTTTRSIAVLATTTLLAAGGLIGATTSADAAPAPHRGNTSLADVLAADGHDYDDNWKDFDILDAAVTTVLTAKPDSPVAVLADGSVRLTAFAPTDRAFQRLAKALTGSTPATEEDTFNAIAGAAGVDTVETVLLYHVVPGKTLGSAKVLKADGAKLTTAQGGKVTVQVKKKQVTLVDKDPDLRNPRVIAVDINKGNPQIAHAIDRVLLPVDL
ncbi:fasciclin domain-containing protein [Nocardioides sp.]|uniref:fasciclin domain-containing protein n=1 Tax=Nocardioides sp. TaxID=35761 RepID=UPI003783CD71